MLVWLLDCELVIFDRTSGSVWCFTWIWCVYTGYSSVFLDKERIDVFRDMGVCFAKSGVGVLYRVANGEIVTR